MEHPSNFTLTLPSFVPLHAVACKVAEHFYQVGKCFDAVLSRQIPADITFLLDPDGEPLSPLLKLDESGALRGAKGTLYVQSKGERFGSQCSF